MMRFSHATRHQAATSTYERVSARHQHHLANLSCRCQPGFTRWLDGQGTLDTVYLSAVTIHEMEKGIRLLEHKGATAKARNIRNWLRGLIAGYDASVLPIDAETAWLSGELEALAMAAGHAPGAADAMIAGTASAMV